MAGTLTASIIKNDTTSPPAFQNSAGTEIGTLCRAWVNFNGNTSPGTIRASFNVSSVTRNATQDFTINFTNALADANYAFAGAGQWDTTASNNEVPLIGVTRQANYITSSSLRIWVGVINIAAQNPLVATISVFR